MSDNTSELLDTLRDVLFGREFERFRSRLDRIEDSARQQPVEIVNQLRQQAQEESENHTHEFIKINEKLDAAAQKGEEFTSLIEQLRLEITQSVSQNLAELSSKIEEMRSFVDAHRQDTVDYTHREIQKAEMHFNDKINSLRDEKIDRKEMMQRLSRMVNAAMEDDATTQTLPIIGAPQSIDNQDPIDSLRSLPSIDPPEAAFGDISSENTLEPTEENS